MSAQFQTFGPFFHNGELVTTPKLFHYEPGTSQERTAWEDYGQVITAANPIEGDANGIVSGYFDGLYKIRVTTDDEAVLLGDWDNVEFVSSSGQSDAISPVTFGAVANASTSAGTNDAEAFQDAVDAAASSGQILRASGHFRLDTTVTLPSNLICDFRGATFYGGLGLDGQYMFYGASVNNVTVLGGTFFDAVYSPKIVLATGTYANYTGLHFSGGDNITILDCQATGLWTFVNLYDTITSRIQGIYTANGNASIAVLAKTRDVYGVLVGHNRIIGCGDDGIALLSSGGSSHIYGCQVTNNYIDKIRFGSSTTAAVGIRAGTELGSTGTIRGITISQNNLLNMVEHGLYLYDLHDSIIAQNVIDGYAKRSAAAITLGLPSAGASSGNLVTANIVRNPLTDTAFALTLGTSTDTLVMGNRLVGNYTGTAAVYIENSTDNTIAGNAIENASNATIQEAGTSTRNRILDNDARVWSSTWMAMAAGSSARGNKSSAGALQGTAVLVAGTVTVATTEVRTGDKVLISRTTTGGTVGHLSVGTITNATSFVINSSSGTDTWTVFWQIIH